MDLLFQEGRHLKAVEIKSATTFHRDQLKGLSRFRSITGRLAASYLIYNGEEHVLSDSTTAINFKGIRSIFDPPPPGA